jgi:hypothetical protein
MPMRNLLALLFVGLLPVLPQPAKSPPPKEWQALVDATTGAIRKNDAVALDKLLMSFVEAGAACSINPAGAKDAEELDKRRPRRIALALEDCNIVDWKAARFVSASGGEPSPSKCDKFTPAKDISLLYDDGTLMWTVTLEPVVLNGKRLLRTTPHCMSSLKK